MYAKIGEFIERNIRAFGNILVIVVVSLWVLSQFLPVIEEWIINQDLLGVLAVVLLVDAMKHIIDIKREGLPAKRVQFYRNQSEAIKEIDRYLRKNHPRHVRMIEYSTHTIFNLLERLVEYNCKVELMVQHPDLAINEHQRRRIKLNIDYLEKTLFNQYDQIEIRLYKVPASIRGRNLDGVLVNLGWYTYTSGEEGIYGHSNPMINAYTECEEGQYLQDMFDQAFDWLWTHPNTSQALQS